MRHAQPVDLSGRTVVVTGAGPGSIGAETARALAGWGAEVIATTRSGSADLDERVVLRPLELTDAASVARFADWFGSRPLDVLINNAGVHLDLRRKWSQPNLTADNQEIHWRTNYLGTAHLTQLLLPNLRAAEQARVVNVVSMLHSRARNPYLFAPPPRYDSWVAYGTSKLALIHHAGELHRREGLLAYSLHPGAVYSNIADAGLANAPMVTRLRRLLGPIERRMLASVTDGAQTSLHCASVAGLAPGYYRDCRPAEPSTDARDADAAARLWDETAVWLADQPSTQ